MKIDKIIKLKNEKYKISIDGELLIVYGEAILDNNLIYKKNIDKDIYNKLIYDNNYYDIYNKVKKYILKKRRSEKEIIVYLNKFQLNESDKTKMITKLKQLNLINDIEYCRAFVNDKVYLSKNGINKIKIDLLNENIPIEIIESELNKIDKQIIDDRMEKLILKKIINNKRYSNYQLRQKLINEMINLGYPKEKIIEIIDKNINNRDDILISEFKKLYFKLSLKYKDYELNNKIKQKLLSKGFELEKINLLLEQNGK